MIYIQKQSPSVKVAEQIRQAKITCDWKLIEKTDTVKIRNSFDLLDKTVIREQLLQEQRGLCGYCMRRIENDIHTTIEHVRPIESDGEGALDYSNMMACCDGGRGENDEKHVLCCDAAKGSKEISVSPYNMEQMHKIRYDRNGRIYTFPQDDEIDNDINHILNLNGKVDDKGDFQYDTSTGIIAGRKQAYRECQNYLKGISEKKGLKRILERRRDEIQNAAQRKEYAGVWLYLLNRKLRQLQ